MIYILTLIISVLFVFNMWRDPRNLWNAFLFLATLGMLYFSALELAFEHSDILYPLLLLVLVAVPFVIVFLGIFLVVNGFVILQKEGKTLGNSLSLLLGLSLLGYMVLAFWGIRFGQYLALQLPILYYIFIYSNFLFLLFAFIFLAFFLYSLLYHFLPKKRDYDYIIIHGAGLWQGEEVTPLLARRIDKAMEAYFKAGKSGVKLIASGGQGSDEKISEARPFTAI